MNEVTLEAIVDSSHFVKDEVVLGNENAKKELISCLPLERGQFNEFAKDKKTDFVKGYDDRFPRIDMNVVKNSVNVIDGVAVPAFAIYDVFSDNDEYSLAFSVTSNTIYSKQSELAKKLVPHDPLKMRFYNHLWRNFSSSDSVPFIFFGFILSMAFLFIFSSSVVLKSILLPVSFIGFVYGIFIANRATNSLNISRKFSHKFSGIIPSNIREIATNEKKNFGNIYLIEEAYNWKIDDSVTIQKKQNPDPLIVGSKDGKYFLLAKFDVTPLENLIATEYTA